MKLHALRYFVVLAEELHFGRAAERLAITQPPLSAAIQGLEAELGVRLLDRNPKRVQLTPAGSAFLAEAQQVLARVARAAETARAVAGGLRGRLDVGVTGSMAYRDVPRIVRAFQQRLPGIELTLRELSTVEQLDALRHGQLHAGFVNAATVPPPLAALALPAETLVACLPAGHPLDAGGPAALDLRRLADEAFVMFARDVAPAHHDHVVATFSRAGIHPRMVHAARQWLTVVALVAGGLGVALVPASVARSGAAGVRFVPLAQPATLGVGLLAWSDAAGGPVLEAFVQTARELLGAGAAAAAGRAAGGGPG